MIKVIAIQTGAVQIKAAQATGIALDGFTTFLVD
jgi:hypothetical protein